MSPALGVHSRAVLTIVSRLWPRRWSERIRTAILLLAQSRACAAWIMTAAGICVVVKPLSHTT